MVAAAGGGAGAAEDVDVEAVGAEAAVMATNSRLSKVRNESRRRRSLFGWRDRYIYNTI